MPITLINQDEINALPEDNDEQAFVEFEAMCRKEMNSILSNYGQNDDPGEVRFEYMAQVGAAARAYGVVDFEDASPASYDSDAFGSFYTQAVAVTLALGVQGRRQRSARSVELGTAAKERLKRHADVLLETLNLSEMAESRRTKLKAKLKEFTDELEKPRSDMAKMLAAVALVSAALTSTAGLLGSVEDNIIKLPQVVEAVQKITVLIGQAKAIEIESAPERVRPPARLTAPVPKRIADQRGFGYRGRSPREAFPADLDDEIPF